MDILRVRCSESKNLNLIFIAQLVTARKIWRCPITGTYQDKAFNVGKALVEKLWELIPRQQYKLPIQASIGSRIIASTSISAIRKDVLAKCYGGDISRKKKLLKK